MSKIQSYHNSVKENLEKILEWADLHSECKQVECLCDLVGAVDCYVLKLVESLPDLQPATLSFNNICKEAVAKFGITAQEFMCIEECAELIDVLAKQSRGRVKVLNIIEELADVYIMVLQMAHFYGLQDFNDKVDEKLQRLQNLIKFHQ